ncbi:MAG TPA: helix-turn-helix transcriptional regulator [Candidatus Acidoferrum sp.]|nr:helix-turn-helix transcriptional regulator [Candidatus Acidoferrum sp.]
MLDGVAAIYAHHDLESFGRRLLSLVPKMVSATYSSYNEFNPRQRRGAHIFDPPDVSLGPPDRAWALLLREQPLIRHYQRTGDGTARKISDFMSRGAYHETALYCEIFRRAGVEFQMAFYLPERPPNSVAIALIRDHRDFSEQDRLVLNLLRPHLFQAYGNAQIIHELRREAAGMTGALEATARSVIALDSRGAMRTCPACAHRWLRQYFPKPREAQQLPDAVRSWIRQQQLPATRANELPRERLPLVAERELGRLTIRLLNDCAPGRSLLVLEERAKLSAAALRKLGLTGREAEVLWWLAQGKSNPEIGIILRLSTGTVHKHTEHIFQKLGVETRTAAAALAFEVLFQVSG